MQTFQYHKILSRGGEIEDRLRQLGSVSHT